MSSPQLDVPHWAVRPVSETRNKYDVPAHISDRAIYAALVNTIDPRQVAHAMRELIETTPALDPISAIGYCDQFLKWANTNKIGNDRLNIFDRITGAYIALSNTTRERDRTIDALNSRVAKADAIITRINDWLYKCKMNVGDGDVADRVIRLIIELQRKAPSDDEYNALLEWLTKYKIVPMDESPRKIADWALECLNVLSAGNDVLTRDIIKYEKRIARLQRNLADRDKAIELFNERNNYWNADRASLVRQIDVSKAMLNTDKGKMIATIQERGERIIELEQQVAERERAIESIAKPGRLAQNELARLHKHLAQTDFDHLTGSIVDRAISLINELPNERIVELEQRIETQLSTIRDYVGYATQIKTLQEYIDRLPFVSPIGNDKSTVDRAISIISMFYGNRP